MGLGSLDWVTLLRTKFPNAFTDDACTDLHPVDVVLEDTSQTIRHGRSEETGADWAEWWVKHINSYPCTEVRNGQMQPIEEYVLCADERVHTPQNKSRAGKPSALPYTDEEVIGGLLCYDNGALPEIDRAVLHPALKEDCFRFVTSVIKKKYADEGVRGPPRIVFDGARVEEAPGKKSQFYPHLAATRACYMTIQRHTQDQPVPAKPFSVEKSNEIGEADCKFVYHLARHQGKRVVIRGYDTDSIVVTLLALRDHLEPETQIYVDTSVPQKKTDGKEVKEKTRFLHVNVLYNELYNYFNKHTPNVVFPHETFCFLVLLKGNDFVEHDGLAGIGPTKIWDHFFARGHIIAAPPPEQSTGLYEREKQMVHNGMDLVCNHPEHTHEVVVNEMVAFVYVADLIWSVLGLPDMMRWEYGFRKNVFSELPEVNAAAFKLVYCEQKQLEQAAKNPSGRTTVRLQKPYTYLALFRRIHWYLNYAQNNGKPGVLGQRYQSPVLMDPRSGMHAKHGWRMVEKWVGEERTSKVERTNSVFVDWFKVP